MENVPFTTNKTVKEIDKLLCTELTKAINGNHWRFDYPVTHTVVENEELSVTFIIESQSLLVFVHYSDTKPHHFETNLRMYFIGDDEGRCTYKEKRTDLPSSIKVPVMYRDSDKDDDGKELLHILEVSSGMNKFLADMIPVINKYANSVSKHVQDLALQGFSNKVMGYKA